MYTADKLDSAIKDKNATLIEISDASIIVYEKIDILPEIYTKPPIKPPVYDASKLSIDQRLARIEKEIGLTK